MSATGGHLAIRTELCDHCGDCVRACPQGKLRVGAGYIYVDVSECTGCFSCVEACPRGAILRRRPGQLVAQAGSGGKVVVGSRAEAKALRKQAATAEKIAAKPSAKSGAVASAKAGGAVKERVGWSIVDAVAVAAVLLASMFAKEAVLGSAAVSLMPASGRVASRALVLGVFYAIQIGLLAFLAHRKGLHLAKAFRLKPASFDLRKGLGAAGLVALLLLGTRVVSTAWGAVSQGVGWLPPASEALTGVFGGGGLGLVLAVLMVVLVGPFVEELAFREVIGGAIFGRFGLWPSVLGSAALFSAYHLTAWVIVPTFVLGCALGWLAHTRNSMWPAIALHVLYNGVVVAAAFWLPAG